MNTEVRICGTCGKQCDPNRSILMSADGTPLCVPCSVESFNREARALRREEREEARETDMFYDSDDWTSDEESDDEE